MGKIVAKYHGVQIIESCGYYYPEVNGDAEFKSIKEAKEWIENVWLFTQNNMNILADTMGVNRNLLWNNFINLKR